MERFNDVDLSGARFRNVNLSGVKMVDVSLVDARLSGLIDGLVVNDIEVAPLIAAEIERRYPERTKLFARDPERPARRMVDDRVVVGRHARASAAASGRAVARARRRGMVVRRDAPAPRVRDG